MVGKLDPFARRRSTGFLRVLGLLVTLAAVSAAAFLVGRFTAPGGRWASEGRPPLPEARKTDTPMIPPPTGAPPGPELPSTTQAPGIAEPAPDAPPPPSGGARTIVAGLSGALEDTLSSAMPRSERKVAERLTQVVNRLLVWDLRISREGMKGDKIEVIYSPADAEGPAASGSGEPIVDALRYTSTKRGKVYSAYRYRAKGAKYARYYRVDGSEIEEKLVVSPIAEYDQITSLLRDGRKHKGVDFRAPVGTPVFATFDGVIERRNWNWVGNGNCLDVRDSATGRHALYYKVI